MLLKCQGGNAFTATSQHLANPACGLRALIVNLGMKLNLRIHGMRRTKFVGPWEKSGI